MTRPLAIVDAHHHVWDPDVNYHPWLRDRPVTGFRYGDYSRINRRYLVPDYLADARAAEHAGHAEDYAEYLVGLARRRVHAPMYEDAELGVAIPLGHFVMLERSPCRFERSLSGDGVDFAHGTLHALLIALSAGENAAGQQQHE